MCTFYIAHLESAGNNTLVQLVLQFKPFSICVLKIAFNFTVFMKFENLISSSAFPKKYTYAQYLSFATLLRYVAYVRVLIMEKIMLATG